MITTHPVGRLDTMEKLLARLDEVQHDRNFAWDPDKHPHGEHGWWATTEGNRIVPKESWPAEQNPAPHVDGSNIRAVLQAFRDEIVGRSIQTPLGLSFTPQPGHFFTLVSESGRKEGKGWVSKADSSSEAMRMISAGEIEAKDVYGYREDRAENLLLLPDLLSKPQVIIKQPGIAGTAKKDAFVFVKRYQEHGERVTVAATFNADGQTLALTSFGYRWLGKKLPAGDIVWHSATAIK